MSEKDTSSEFIELRDLLHRKGWNMRTVKTFLDGAGCPGAAKSPDVQALYFPLPQIRSIEQTERWNVQAENLERKRAKQKQRELERWERERPTYREVGEADLGESCRIVIPTFPGLTDASPDSATYDLLSLDPLAAEPWKFLIYKVQGKGDERLTFSLFALSRSLVPVTLQDEVTDEEIRDAYPFLIPTWEPSLFEEDAEAAFRTVEGERLEWERVWGPQRIPFNVVALMGMNDTGEGTRFLQTMDQLFYTTRRKRKNTPYSSFVSSGYSLFARSCAIPSGGSRGIEGIFVHRNSDGLLDGIWIDLDFSDRGGNDSL